MSTQAPIWYDCNVAIGRPQTGCYAPLTTAQALLDALDWVGVQQALVYHVLMQTQSPVVGNRALMDALATLTPEDAQRLTPAWAILPPHTGEFVTPYAFFEDMKHSGVRALWAFPQEHRYLLNRTTMGDLLRQVSDKQIPLFLPRKAGGNQPHETYQLLDHLLYDFPGLRVVLTSQGPWGEDRFFRPLLDKYPNFYLDISRYELDCGLRELVKYCGAERLLYGSNAPSNGMGGPRLMLARAEIGEPARAAIAGGNLARLLREVQL